MIQDIQELSASLRYISLWTDQLEGLRRHEEQTKSGLLSTTSAGPLAEIRRVAQEAREFVETLPRAASSEGPTDYRLPLPERQKAA